LASQVNVFFQQVAADLQPLAADAAPPQADFIPAEFIIDQEDVEVVSRFRAAQFRAA